MDLNKIRKKMSDRYDKLENEAKKGIDIDSIPDDEIDNEAAERYDRMEEDILDRTLKSLDEMAKKRKELGFIK